jgi:hypothetical protein
VWIWNAGDCLVRVLSSRRWFDGGIIAIVAVASLYGAARLGLKPRAPDSGVGVVFAPWVSETAAIRRATEAGARFVRFGGAPFIVVVMPETPDYLARIAADGAVLLVDPKVLAACLSLAGGAIRS